MFPKRVIASIHVAIQVIIPTLLLPGCLVNAVKNERLDLLEVLLRKAELLEREVNPPPFQILFRTFKQVHIKF